jgi:Zn finger protein HypA/HybF involved in hydrogenase expression
MHEHGLGDLILRDLEPSFAAVPPGGGLRVRARVSEVSGLSAGPLQQALDHAHEHHAAPPIHLELLSDGLLGRCTACGAVSVVNEDLACPVCKSTEVTLCAGETLLIEEVTVCTAPAQPPVAEGEGG